MAKWKKKNFIGRKERELGVRKYKGKEKKREDNKWTAQLLGVWIALAKIPSPSNISGLPEEW